MDKLKLKCFCFFLVFQLFSVVFAAELISVNSAGTASGNGASVSPGPIADGRFVLFSSAATDLTTTADTNDADDIFLYDRVAGTTVLVSVNSAGTDSGNGFLSGQQHISADGRFVVFDSTASNLTPPQIPMEQKTFSCTTGCRVPPRLSASTVPVPLVATTAHFFHSSVPMDGF
ncbi:MAG: hypothetical protein HC808_09035 [Candidatus Competibacteraceae bacterium]|nr:hypothetical protein [Candidatus Competibacteraceae bacterium]